MRSAIANGQDEELLSRNFDFIVAMTIINYGELLGHNGIKLNLTGLLLIQIYQHGYFDICKRYEREIKDF